MNTKQKAYSFIAISSNDVENYPEDSPTLMKQLEDDDQGFNSITRQEIQEVAKKYNAACTPDFYAFDEDLKSVYHGQFS